MSKAPEFGHDAGAIATSHHWSRWNCKTRAFCYPYGAYHHVYDCHIGRVTYSENGHPRYKYDINGSQVKNDIGGELGYISTAPLPDPLARRELVKIWHRIPARACIASNRGSSCCPNPI